MSRPGSVVEGRRAILVALLLSVVLSAAAGLLYVTATAGGPGYAWRGLPLDDAWIHMVYARSLVHGQPFQYNPGQPETGSTSPLWAILLAPGLLIGLPPPTWPKVLGVLLAAASAAIGWGLLRALGLPAAGRLFVLTLPLVPNLAFASVSGTEVLLFALLMLSALRAAVGRRHRLAGILAGLAMLARPEGAVLAVLLIPLLVWRAWRRGEEQSRPRARHWLREVVLPVLLAVLVIAPWMAFCLSVTGRPLPSTFYAKAGWFGLFNPGQLHRIGAILLDQPFLGGDFEAPILRAIGAIVGFGIVGAGLVELRRRDRALAILAGALPFALLYAQSTVLRMGEILPPDQVNSIRNFYEVRYLLPAIPLLLLLWTIGFSATMGWDPAPPSPRKGQADSRARGRLSRLPAPARVAVAAGLLALPLASAIAQHAKLRDTYSWNCQNIEQLQVRAAKWVAQNLPEGASIGVSDAGAMRFFGRHRTVDLVGLNAHRLLPFLAAVHASPAGGPREAELREQFWRRERLSYLAIARGGHLPLVRGREFDGLALFRLEHNTICAEGELIVAKDRQH